MNNNSEPNSHTPMLSRNIIKGKRLMQYAAAISASLGALCAGTALAWTSPALAQLAMEDTTNDSSTANITHQTSSEDHFTLTPNESATVGGILAIGALLTAIPVGYLSDKIGRKKVILATSVTFLLSWIVIICARNAITLIIGRFFAGMATGAAFVMGPIYIGEIAESETRGTLSSFMQISLCVGVLFTSIVGAYTTWTTLTIVLSIIPVIFGLSFLFMPESPVYLVEIDEIDQAEKVLRVLRDGEFDVTAELKDIQTEVEESHENSSSIKEMFTLRANRRAFVAVVGVLAFQQLTGINGIVFYTVPIFQAAGAGIPPAVAGILIASVQVVASYGSIFIIEKLNRKMLLMISSVGMMISLTAIAMYFHLKSVEIDGIKHLGFIAISGAVMFMAFFCVGFGPVPWMLMGEIFSPEIKGIGNGFGILANWTCAFLVTFFFPIINNGVGVHLSFYIFAIFMGIATVYVYFLVPETRGKSLIEIQEILAK